MCVVVLVVDGGGRVQAAGEGGGSTESWFTPRQRVCDIIRTGTNQKSVHLCVMRDSDIIRQLNYYNNHPCLRCLTYVENPQVSQPAAAHASIDDESVGSAAARHHGRVTLSGRWRRTRCQRDLPADHAGARPQLQTVQVVQIPERETTCL